MLKIDLEGVKAEYVYIILYHCYEVMLKNGMPVTILTTNGSLLLELFRKYKNTPFDLLDITIKGKLWSITMAKTALDNKEELLLISRYRCPGPIAEIMAYLRRLKSHQTLKLVIFSEKFESSYLECRLQDKGYVIKKSTQFTKNLFIVNIQVRQDNQQGNMLCQV